MLVSMEMPQDSSTIHATRILSWFRWGWTLSSQNWLCLQLVIYKLAKSCLLIILVNSVFGHVVEEGAVLKSQGFLAITRLSRWVVSVDRRIAKESYHLTLRYIQWTKLAPYVVNFLNLIQRFSRALTYYNIIRPTLSADRTVLGFRVSIRIFIRKGENAFLKFCGNLKSSFRKIVA